jgi:Protein of unknown function (DUF1097)
MSPLVALAVSLALLGAVATALFQSLGLLLWAGFIAWAAFFAAGGDSVALRKTIAGNVFGALVAWVALMILSSVPVEGWLWIPRNGIVVGITVMVLGLAARLEVLSHVPASVYGYAATFGAQSVPTSDASSLSRLSGFHLSNPFIQVAVSMVGGALFGLACGKLMAVLKKA